MLKDRGYIVSEKKLNMTKQEFQEQYSGQRETLNGLFEKRTTEDQLDPNGNTEKLLLFFPDQDKINAKALQQIAMKMIEIECMNAMVILKGTTPIAKKVTLKLINACLQELDELKPCEIQIFLQQELLVNITEHELVPKHEVLSDKAKSELLKKQ